MVHLTGRWSAVSPRGVSLKPALWLLAILAVTSLYDVYRYPARINASATSPTYTNTPLWLSAGKYVMVLVLTGGLALTLRMRLRGRLLQSAADRILLALIAWLLAAGTVHVLVAHSSEVVRPLGALLGVAPLIILLPALFAVEGPATDALERLVLPLAFGLLFLHAAVDLIEIALWIVVGRLPALGYAGALVRFGGVWDDPNSAGAYAALCLVLLIWRPFGLSRRERGVLVAAGALVLAASWSLSGGLMLLSGLLVLGALRSTDRPRFALRSLAVAAVVLAAAPLIVLTYDRLPLVGHVLQQKVAGSVGSRQSALAHGLYIASLPHDPVAWLVGRAHPQQNEAAIVWWIDTVGLMGTVLLACWLTLTLRRVWSTPAREPAMALSAAVLVGSLFVPYLTTVPIGSYFLLGVAWLAARAPGTPEAPTARREPAPAHGRGALSDPFTQRG